MITNVITTATPVQVLTLDRVKQHLRIESDFVDEDDLILSYLEAAVVHCENFIGGHVTTKLVKIEATYFDDPFFFEEFPVDAISSVKYYNSSNILTIMPPSNYKLTSYSGKYFALRFLTDVPSVYDRFDAVAIEYSVGYADVPKPIIQAILLLIGAMYENREDDTKTTFQRVSSASNLLYAYKKY